MPRPTLEEIFSPNQSPYFGMFRAGIWGYSIQEVTNYLNLINIPIRPKDIRSWEDGSFKYNMRKFKHRGILNPYIPTMNSTDNCYLKRVQALDVKLADLQSLPNGWRGTDQRFFPCTQDNKPMMSWGWKENKDPGLMYRVDAEVLSPSHWVGQNMLYQPFVVLDIDGVGHGCIDQKVIDFGNQFKNTTMTLEDPNKIGSFHLYFTTDKLVPVKHFPHAKLDLMGNAVNAAVYFKNKESNGIPPAPLTEDIWSAMLEYQKARLEERRYYA